MVELRKDQETSGQQVVVVLLAVETLRVGPVLVAEAHVAMVCRLADVAGS